MPRYFFISFFVAVIVTGAASTAQAGLDLIVDDPEELLRHYQQDRTILRDREKQDNAAGNPEDEKDLESLLSEEPFDPADIMMDNKPVERGRPYGSGADPVFSTTGELETLLEEDLRIETPEQNVSIEAVRAIVQRPPERKIEIEKDKLQGAVLVPDAAFLDDPRSREVYEIARSLHRNRVQVFGFKESGFAQAIGSVNAALAPFLDKKIDIELVDSLTARVKESLRKNNFPFSNVYAPPQKIENGIVYLVAKPAIVEDIRIAEGEYFDAARVAGTLTQGIGDPVDTEQLEKDLAWLSLHPDRNIKAKFSPGKLENTTRIDLEMEEFRPWRVYAGLSNRGTPDLDRRQISLGGYHNNVWGLDHQLSYQYTASMDRKSMEAHSGEYKMPLPWKHFVSLQGVRSETKADLLDNTFETEGKFTQIGGRYTIPVLGKRTPFEGWALSGQSVSAGVDRKQIEGDILFTLFGEPLDTGIGADLDVVNTVLEYEGLLEDPYGGSTSFEASAVYSPGNLTSKNGDRDFLTARSNVESSYLYARLKADHTMPLDIEFLDKPVSFEAGFSSQLSADRLVGSERFVSTPAPGFRGYSTGAFSGDSGYGAYVQLRTAPYNLVSEELYRDSIQGTIFADFGSVFNKAPENGEEYSDSFRAVGGSLFYRINDNINAELIFAQDMLSYSEEEDRDQSIMYRMLYGY